jgi:predicted RNA-binding protein
MMVSEILKKYMKNSRDKTVVIFLDNGFRYECQVIDCDDEFVKIFDLVKQKEKLINLNQITEVNV